MLGVRIDEVSTPVARVPLGSTGIERSPPAGATVVGFSNVELRLATLREMLGASQGQDVTLRWRAAGSEESIVLPFAALGSVANALLKVTPATAEPA